ncbi:MAG TPA: HD domain-containing protein [Desulfocapsa sulfexigens]|nr:HD domain-containing protein [Desulfocapsa sulfexigens]
MITAIAPQHIEQYLAETRELLYQRIATIGFLGISLFLLFSLLDFIVVREYFTLFLIWRLLCSTAIIIVLLYKSRSRLVHKQPFIPAIILYTFGCLTISSMIVALGGYETGYYMGFILLLYIFTTLLPLSDKQYLIIAALTFLSYLIPVVLLCDIQPFSKEIFTTNNFFLIAAIIILFFQSHENNRSLALEFNMRMEKNDYAQKLSTLADSLEDEVLKRTLEFESSEHRYKQLYENINDDIILLDQQGAILRSNKRFARRMKRADRQIRNIAFLSFVHPDDRRHVDKALFAPFSRGEEAKNVDFRLQLSEKEIFYVECNGSVIKKENRVIGSQLLLRDTSERKRLEEKLEHSFQTEQNARESIILALANLAEYREMSTGTNLKKIRNYSLVLADELSGMEQYKAYINKEYKETLYHSSILHDIGKVGIPDTILLKKEPLTEEERRVIQEHVIFGGKTLKAIETQTTGQSFLEMGIQIAFFHHERWDGTGYPYGLKKEEIPLSASIIALVDTYEAMTSPRVFRDAYTHQEALKTILSERGKQFAPDIVDAFMARQKDFQDIEQSLNIKQKVIQFSAYDLSATEQNDQNDTTQEGAHEAAFPVDLHIVEPQPESASSYLFSAHC